MGCPIDETTICAHLHPLDVGGGGGPGGMGGGGGGGGPGGKGGGGCKETCSINNARRRT